VRLSSTHLLALSKGKNVKVEIFGQNRRLTSYKSTEIMNEKMDHLHYSALTRTLEDDMWIIDSGASRHMTGDQDRLSNLNEKKTSYKVELGDKNTYPVEGIGQASAKLKTCNNVSFEQCFICTWFRKESCIHILPRRQRKHNSLCRWKSIILV
jgi:hypothetical protein